MQDTTDTINCDLKHRKFTLSDIPKKTHSYHSKEFKPIINELFHATREKEMDVSVNKDKRQ